MGLSAEQYSAIFSALGGLGMYIGKRIRETKGTREERNKPSLPKADPCADVATIAQRLREENERLCDELREKDETIDFERERADRERTNAEDFYGKWMRSRGMNHDVRTAARNVIARATNAGVDCADIEARLAATEIRW